MGNDKKDSPAHSNDNADTTYDSVNNWEMERIGTYGEDSGAGSFDVVNTLPPPPPLPKGDKDNGKP